MRSFATVVFAAVTIATALLGPIAYPSPAATLDDSVTDLVAQVNQFRASRGLPTLVISDTLTASAKWMSTDMSAQDYFEHRSLDGRTPAQRMADAGYPAYSTWTGEDLAAGYTSAREVLDGWIASPSHYAVLTNPAYRAIGVARSYAASSRYQWYWSADFGGVAENR